MQWIWLWNEKVKTSWKEPRIIALTKVHENVKETLSSDQDYITYDERR